MINKKKIFLMLCIAFAIFCFWNFSKSENNNELFSKKVKVALRAIGHQILLSNKDSITLILPVNKITENKYQISFEKHLYINPEILVSVVKNAFQKSDFPKNYFVEVIQCATNDVVYS